MRIFGQDDLVFLDASYKSHVSEASHPQSIGAYKDRIEKLKQSHFNRTMLLRIMAVGSIIGSSLALWYLSRTTEVKHGIVPEVVGVVGTLVSLAAIGSLFVPTTKY